MIEFLRGTVTPRDWGFVAGILGAAAAVAAGFYFFVHTGQQEQLLALQILDAQKVQDLNQARTINDEIDALRTETKQIEALVKEFEERLPTSREIVSLLKDFQQLADEEDVEVVFRSQSRTRDARKETIPYEVIARGNFHQLAGFINRLERFKRFLKISNLDVAEMREGTAEARFTLNTYRFIQSNTTGGA